VIGETKLFWNFLCIPGLKLMILLPQLPVHWHYRYVLPHPPLIAFVKLWKSFKLELLNDNYRQL
jgi:hypothetical protein